GKAGEGSWYGMLRSAAEELPLLPGPEGRMRHEVGEWHPPLAASASAAAPVALPERALRDASPAPAAKRVITPSDLGGAKTLPGEGAGEPDALARGTLLHGFLERFPGLDAADRDNLAQAARELAARAAALIADTALAPLFGPESLAEVGFALDWNGGLLTGAIYRLVIAPDRVLV